MTQRDDIAALDLQGLEIIHYPDPRLLRPAEPLEEIGEYLAPLAARMFEIMAEARGVGLAAPQVGLSLQLFVACPSGEPTDRRVYVNPTLLELEGHAEQEEGCLSVPGVSSRIRRYGRVKLEATNLSGQRFQETGEGLLARIFQHETDHLDGRLIIDRMGSLARLTHRGALKELRENFESEED